MAEVRVTEGSAANRGGHRRTRRGGRRRAAGRRSSWALRGDRAPAGVGELSAREAAQAIDFVERAIGREKTISVLAGQMGMVPFLDPRVFAALNRDEVSMQHRKEMRTHPQLAAALLVIQLFLASARYRLECEDPDIELYAYELLRRVWKPLTRAMLGAVVFGYAPFEKLWKTEDLRLVDRKTGRVLSRPAAIMYRGLKDIDPETAELWLKGHGKYAGFAQPRFRVKRLPPRNTFWYAHMMEWGNLFGCPRVNKGTFNWWVYNVIAWQLMMRYVERTARPPIKGYAPDGFRRYVDPDSGTQKIWEPIKVLHDQLLNLLEGGVLVMPNDMTQDGKHKYSADYFTDPSPAMQRLTAAVTESGFMMLYSVLVPPQIFQSLMPARGQGYGFAAAQAGLAADGVDLIMSDMADWIENGNEVYGVPSVLQEPVRLTFGPNAPHVHLHPTKISRGRRQLLGELLTWAVRLGMADVDFDKVVQELGLGPEARDELQRRDGNGNRTAGVPAKGRRRRRDGRGRPPKARAGESLRSQVPGIGEEASNAGKAVQV